MLHCHQSQFYEWLPYNAGILDQVPKEDAEQRSWMAERRLQGFQKVADQYRKVLISTYGEEKESQIHYAEAFEACEYGAPLTEKRKRQLLIDF